MITLAIIMFGIHVWGWSTATWDGWAVAWFVIMILELMSEVGVSIKINS